MSKELNYYLISYSLILIFALWATFTTKDVCNKGYARDLVPFILIASVCGATYSFLNFKYQVESTKKLYILNLNVVLMIIITLLSIITINSLKNIYYTVQEFDKKRGIYVNVQKTINCKSIKTPLILIAVISSITAVVGISLIIYNFRIKKTK